MSRLLFALVLMLVMLPASPAMAATQTCIIVTVRDSGGAGLANVTVKRDGGNAKATDGSGTTLWCVSVSQTSCELRLVDGTITASQASGAAASVRNGVAYIAWLRGTDQVEVTLTAQATGATPTPSRTPAPTATARPTVTAGPSPTRLPTPTRWAGWFDASAIIEIEPGTWPGSYNIRLIDGGGVRVYMQTHEGGDYPSGCGTDCTTQFSWARLYFECEPDMPPSPPTFTPTATATASRAATATATQTLTQEPTKTPTPPWWVRLEGIQQEAAEDRVKLIVTAVFEWDDLGK